jgi:tetratricopeptide (TPR) repeat protein
MRASTSWWPRGLAALALAVYGARPLCAAGDHGPHPLQAECDYGVTLALRGNVAQAESAFVSLLSHAPRDARALNNLGNLALLRGQLSVAMSFYERALEGDSTDAGIMLNQATALMLAGDADAAQAAAARGLARAGGLAPGARLLGITSSEELASRAKGEKRTYISKEEVLMLLNLAAGKVPTDSVLTRPPGARAARRAPLWRSAGARSSDADESSAALVYWKR